MPGRRSFEALAVAAAYVVLSALFTVLYFARTAGWTEQQFLSYTLAAGEYPGYHLLFQDRVLVPLIARACSLVLPLSLSWIYRGIACLSVLGAVESYRRYLAGFVEDRAATALAPALLYPMVWNLCLLNRIYFPFDLPAILLFTLGLHLMATRRWAAYYVVLVLGLLNHEAAALLIVVFWLTARDSMAPRGRWKHLLSQAAVLVGVKCATGLLLGWGVGELGRIWRAGTYLRANALVLRDMATLQGNALRDWAKLVLAFGGAWIALPFVRRRLPAFLRAGVWAGVVYVCFIGVTAIIDEVRGYVVLVPVVLTAVIYAALPSATTGTPRFPSAASLPKPPT